MKLVMSIAMGVPLSAGSGADSGFGATGAGGGAGGGGAGVSVTLTSIGVAGTRDDFALEAQEPFVIEAETIGAERQVLQRNPAALGPDLAAGRPLHRHGHVPKRSA